MKKARKMANQEENGKKSDVNLREKQQRIWKQNFKFNFKKLG